MRAECGAGSIPCRLIFQMTCMDAIAGNHSGQAMRGHRNERREMRNPDKGQYYT